MILTRGRLIVLSALLFAVPVLAQQAQQHQQAQQEDDSRLDGRFRFGLRGVDVNGVEGKYRQHVNLDSGPRLFELRFEYEPLGGFGEAVDRLELDLTNFGGDPFETFRFNLQKYGAYNFQYQRLKSTYFHEDILFPGELEDQRLSLEGDFVTFDVDRVRDVAKFDLNLSPSARLNIGFNRYTRKGDSTTKLRIARVVTPVRRPIDEKMNEFDIGFQYQWKKAALVLQERIRSFDNAYELFLPGASERDPDTTILSFFRDQPYDLKSAQHTVRLNLTPDPRWLIRASLSVENMDFDGDISETSASMKDGVISKTDAAGGGEIQRDTSWIEVDASYLLNERLSLVGGFWRNDLDQDGNFTFGDDENLGRWEMSTTGAEGGLEYGFSRTLTVSGGLRYESRDVDNPVGENVLSPGHSRITTHTGVFVATGWRPRHLFDFNAELETGKYNDPFTLASPTDRVRFRVQAKVNRANGVYLTATYIGLRLKNDNRPAGALTPSNWESDRDQLNARAGYRADRLDVSAGYALVRIKHDVDQTINPGSSSPFLIPILYKADSDFIDGRIRWRFLPEWRLGGDLRFYDNDGSFAVRRNDVRAYVEVTVYERYFLNLGYRRIDYEEKLRGFNNYDANIVEGSIGYAW
ncbi:MAG: hypothetical protein BMS9Abin37_0367 [Acidobacteriota bacterium]|nr:MAG: hypothetical protein BMS9Abin37_0367 [Acidobacteriota bacterium]